MLEMIVSFGRASLFIPRIRPALSDGSRVNHMSISQVWLLVDHFQVLPAQQRYAGRESRVHRLGVCNRCLALNGRARRRYGDSWGERAEKDEARPGQGVCRKEVRAEGMTGISITYGSYAPKLMSIDLERSEDRSGWDFELWRA